MSSWLGFLIWFFISYILFLLLQILSVSTDEGIASILCTDKGLDVLEAIGYRGDPRRSSMKDKDKILQ